MKKVYFLIMTVFLMSMTVWSKTTTWDGSASTQWDNSENWNNGVPASGDIVIFPTNTSGIITRVAFAGDISLNSLSILGNSVIELRAAGARTITISNGVTGNDFIINPAAQLTLGINVNLFLAAGANAGIPGRFNVNANRTYTTNGITIISATTGILNNTGTVISPASTNLRFQNAATYIHAQDGGAIPNATWAATSNATIIGVNNIVPTGLGQNFGNFEWNSGQNVDLDLNGSLKNVAGDLTISKTSGNVSPRFLNLTSATNYTLAIGRDFIIKRTAPATTNVYFVNDGVGDAIITVARNYIHQDGNLVFVDVNADGNDGTATLNLTGNLIKSGGDIDFTSGGNGPAGRKGSLNIKGNFTQTAGTIRSTTEDVQIPNGLITFNKSGLQTFNAATPSNITYTNFVVAGGSTLRLASGLAISRDTEPNFIGKFTVNGGAILDVSTFVISSQIAPDVTTPGSAVANFTLSVNGKIITANANGVQGSVRTANNLVASLSSDADYEFQGASTGAFTTTTPNTIRDLIINRATGNIILDMPLRIKRTLNLTKGLLTTTLTNLATIVATGTASPATSMSFVNGPLAKEGTTAFTFPVGKLGAGFRNIGITTPSGSATFRAEFVRASAPPGTLEPGLKRVSSCEYWDLSKTAGAASVSANVVLSWEANSNCNSDEYVTNPTTLRVAHLLSGTWIDEGRSSSTGDN
ncbi:MAG: beta strand repeat-containing protein, partial [Chitinophagaceae bacterium]